MNWFYSILLLGMIVGSMVVLMITSISNRVSRLFVGATVICLISVGIFILLSDHYGWSFTVQTILLLAFIVLLYSLFIVPPILDRPVLLVGIVPGIVVMGILWFFHVVQYPSEEPTGPAFYVAVFTTPIAITLLFSLAYVPFGWALFLFRDRPHCHNILKHFLDLSCMVWLAAPSVGSAFIFPQYLSDKPTLFSIIAVFIVGILWSTLIATPFQHFVKAIDTAKRIPSTGSECSPLCGSDGPES